MRQLSPKERSDLLDQNLMAMAANGARVINRSGDAAVILTGKPVNHVLHLLITIFCTCGLWVPVWLALVVFGGEKRSTVSVDPYGQVLTVKAPLATHQIVILCLAGAWLLLWLIAFIGAVAGS